MKSAVTISLVPESREGPFVYHGELAVHMREAAKLGFDAVELFPPSADAIDRAELKSLLGETGLAVAAVGTGAGWLKQKLTLTSADAVVRERARAFVEGMLEFATEFEAPVIIGSMQGRWDSESSKGVTMARLSHELASLSSYAAKLGTHLLYEPLNRYETNLCQTLADGLTLVNGLSHVKLLADLFHMAIEETNLGDAIRAAGASIGHVHFADSNRRAAGMGHTDFVGVVHALHAIGYTGYLSAEVFPLPNPTIAAQKTIESISKLLQ